LGILAIAMLMFGAGYGFGWFRSAGAANAESPADMGNPGEGKKVASLGDLLPGLEAKVAANPGDASQRMLLAQTYAELGQRDKSIEQLRAVRKQTPGDTEATILLATSLLERGGAADLKESFALLDAAVRAKPAVVPMARLYQGEIRMKLGDKAGAVKIWKDHVAQMSAGDPRRSMFQERIEQAGGRP
jgi:cytochrome c-type biogenesis protein CcmH/NrfG